MTVPGEASRSVAEASGERGERARGARPLRPVRLAVEDRWVRALRSARKQQIRRLGRSVSSQPIKQVHNLLHLITLKLVGHAETSEMLAVPEKQVITMLSHKLPYELFYLG